MDVTFEYTHNVYSPADRAGAKGQQKKLPEKTARHLAAQGYGRIIDRSEKKKGKSDDGKSDGQTGGESGKESGGQGSE